MEVRQAHLYMHVLRLDFQESRTHMTSFHMWYAPGFLYPCSFNAWSHCPTWWNPRWSCWSFVCLCFIDKCFERLFLINNIHTTSSMTNKSVEVHSCPAEPSDQNTGNSADVWNSSPGWNFSWSSASSSESDFINSLFPRWCDCVSWTMVLPGKCETGKKFNVAAQSFPVLYSRNRC